MKTTSEKSSSTASRSQQDAKSFFSKSNQPQEGKANQFFPATVQSKLNVSRPGDAFEKEADQMADHVVQRSSAIPVQSKCNNCEDNKDSIQKKPLADSVTPFVQRKENQSSSEEEQVQQKQESPEESPIQKKEVDDNIQKEDQTEEVQTKREEQVCTSIQKSEEEITPSANLQRKDTDAKNPELPEEKHSIANAVQKSEGESSEEERVQSKAIEEEKPVSDNTNVQTKPKDDNWRQTRPDIITMLQDRRGLGSQMQKEVRDAMESGYGVNLQKVRIHTDDQASLMCQQLEAQAFTNGWDVYFNRFKYNPKTRDGKLLLAHELAHTIQQAKSKGETISPSTLRDTTPIIPATPPDPQHIMDEASRDAEEIVGEVKDVESDKVKSQKPPLPKEPAKQKSKNSKSSKANKPCSAQQAPSTHPTVQKAAPAPTPVPVEKEIEGNEEQSVEGVQETDSTPAPVALAKSPQCPAEDPGFAQAKKKIGSNAKKQKAHQPAGDKKDEMVNSAVMTIDEQNKQSGQDQKATALEEAAKPRQNFDRHEFKRKLRENIESKMPGTEKEANAFSKSNKLAEAKDEFKGSIAEEKGKVSGPLEEAKEEPLPPHPNAKPDNILVPGAQPADKPSLVPSGLASPKPKTEGEISLQHESDKLDHQMVEGGITEQQLAESEEPQFEQALTKKKDAQREIAAAPLRYQQVEQEKLAGAQKSADSKTGRELRDMEKTKNEATGQVYTGQTTKESETETRQREIKEYIDAFYTATELDVNDILTKLATAVESKFSTEVESANKHFKDRVTSRLDDHYGWFTFDNKIAEWTGLSDGVAHIFRQEKENFLYNMEFTLDEIAIMVETELNRALERIQTGRTALENYKTTLNTDELAFADSLLTETLAKFTDLESSVESTQDELIDSLADQYVENVNNLQAEFDKIKEEVSASWIVDAVSFIGDVASAIKKLGDLLMSIIDRIGNYISDIMAAPKRFFNNLVSGIKGGMSEFETNFEKYLARGFWKWLTGAASSRDITIPENMDARGMFSLATQILGFDKEFLMKRIGAKLGKDFLDLIKQAEGFGDKILQAADSTLLEPIRIIQKEGIEGLWNWVKEEMSKKLDEIFSKIKEEIFQAIIRKFIIWVATLFIPGLGFIRLIQAAYKALRWLVDNIDRIVEIVNAFLDSIGLAIQGNVSGIVKKVVDAMTNGVVIAIDFLAKLVGLGNFADKLQKNIEGLRKMVTNIIDRVLMKARPLVTRIKIAVKRIERQLQKGVSAVKAGGQKAKEMGKQTLQKIADFLLPKKVFKAGGETHTISVGEKSGDLQMMIASSPQDIRNFVKSYSTKYTLDDRQKKLVTEIESYLKSPMEKTLEDIEKVKKTNGTEDDLKPHRQKLVDQEVELSNKIRLLLDGDTNIGKDVEKYQLEGLNGTYKSMPKPKSDDMTPDHQPQAAVLKEAAQLSIFKGTKLEQAAMEGHAAGGYAINLHKIRHYEGRTYGSKGSDTKKAFIENIADTKSDASMTPDQKRSKIVALLNDELIADVKKIKEEITIYNTKVWTDLTGYPAEKQDELKKQIVERIRNGEDRIAAQNISKYKEKA